MEKTDPNRSLWRDRPVSNWEMELQNIEFMPKGLHPWTADCT